MTNQNNTAGAATRFATQMLAAFGVQRTVTTTTGSVGNTFKYGTGTPVYTDPVGANNITQPGLAVGYCSPTAYNQARCFYIDRGASELYADTMVMITEDLRRMLGTTTGNLLEQFSVLGKIDLSGVAYYQLNKLREPGNQVAKSSATNNTQSLQARQIRA